MRVSANPADKAYDQNACHYRVYLNGKYLRNCHTADEEAGEAWVHLLDPNAREEARRTGLIPSMKVIGIVKIVDTQLLNTRIPHQGKREKQRRLAQIAKGCVKIGASNV
jgi:hypothetical protein